MRHLEGLRLVSTLATAGLLVALAPAAQAQNSCPPGFNDFPALQTHLDQADIASGAIPFKDVFRFGQLLFITDFNKCDGAGRPGTDGRVAAPGAGKVRTPDPFAGPRFTGLSGPDSSSCASCHNEPEVGGAGSFRVNLDDGSPDCVPVAGVDLTADHFGDPSDGRPCRTNGTPTVSDGLFFTFDERGSLGLFGSGAIELLGREMTDDLQALKDQAIQQAQAQSHDVTVALETKGVHFGMLTAHPDGTLDTSAVEGVSPDLVVRPMGRKGNHKSLRRFSNQAFNRHLGMQPQEAVENFTPGDDDPDQDGVTSELTVGDVTALIVFEAALPVPGRAHLRGAAAAQAARGEALFAQANCTSCHIPALPLRSTIFCEPNPRNADGTFADASQQICFDLAKTSGVKRKMVAAYTDLKRHTICDPTRPYDPETNHYCSDVATIPGIATTDPPGPPLSPPNIVDRPPYYQFLTAKLWDVGNSGPWGHRNDLDTIYESIVAHGGEAAASVATYEGLSDDDQLAVVAFLKSLRMPIMMNNPFPQEENSPRAINPGGLADLGGGL